MQIRENVELAPLTTLKIGGPARYYVEVSSLAELTKAITFARDKRLPIYILGGGSNVLVSDAGFAGLIIKPNIQGRKLLSEEDGPPPNQLAHIRVGAGESLDSLIAWCVGEGWWGLENMSYIPGTVAGAVMQNAGAYGQEIAEVIESIEAFDMLNGKSLMLNVGECNFTYRHSIFNTDQKGRYIILNVNLVLNKFGTPNLKYKDLTNFFAPLRQGFAGQADISQKEVRSAIIEIRKSKGQDWVALPSAGSFFSNFQLTGQEFESLCEKIESEFSKEKSSELRDLVEKVKTPSDFKAGKIKLPSAWILDQLLGLKGYVHNERVRVSPYHALNLINTGGATARDMMNLFNYLKDLVYKRTGLVLVNEPDFVGPGFGH